MSIGYANPAATNGRVVEADPTRRYLAGGAGGAYANVPAVLSRAFDDAVAQFGVALYEEILRDSAAGACFETIKQGIVADGLRVQPRHTRDPRKSAKAQDPKVALAADYAGFVERLVRRLARPVDHTLYEMLDGMGFGSKLAEKVWMNQPDGEDAGRLVLEDIEVRPRSSWAFAVDAFRRVVAIAGRTVDERGVPVAGGAGYELIDPEKFLIFTWLPRDGDPRGTSVLRGAYEPWNNKRMLRPLHYKTLYQFGRPRLIHELAPDPVSPFARDAQGNELRDRPRITPEQAATAALAKFEAGTFMVVPSGAKTLLVEAKTDGRAFVDGMDWADRQMSLAIMHNTRTLLEATNGSKADSMTSQDVTRQFQAFGRLRLARLVEDQVFYPALSYNFGGAVAEEFCPRATFGSSSREDFAAYATAVAALKKAGYWQDDQLPWIDSELLGVEPRDPDKAPAPATPAPPAGKGGPAPDPGKGARVVYLSERDRRSLRFVLGGAAA